MYSWKNQGIEVFEKFSQIKRCPHCHKLLVIRVGQTVGSLDCGEELDDMNGEVRIEKSPKQKRVEVA